ncbi:MAG: hypothetical protein ACXQTR_03710 [Candidatus Methanospirareceae archaeon]
MPGPHVREVHIKSSEAVLDVDTLATEQCVSGEIDTSTATSPVEVLTPSTGKKIDTRSVYLATNSTSGEIAAKFRNSGKLLGKIYCSKFAMVTLDGVRIVGDTNEAIVIEWSGLDTGAKIFYVIKYKEI